MVSGSNRLTRFTANALINKALIHSSMNHQSTQHIHMPRKLRFTQKFLQ